MATRVKVSSPRALKKALKRLSAGMEDAVVKAFRETARYGATQALRVSATTKPRPRATGAYERAFKVVKLRDGAALTNWSKHSLFVEVGREPGRRPPWKKILRWIDVKKMVRSSGHGGRGAKGKFKVGAKRLLAYKIAAKIGKHGVKGRYIIKRTVPFMVKRLPREVDLSMQREFDRQARGTK